MTIEELQLALKRALSRETAEAGGRDLSTTLRDSWPDLAPSRSSSAPVAAAIRSIQGKSTRQTTLLQAGLFLMHDFLDESHVQSQSMEGDVDADLWHAIMHRREPDSGNSKYWYRRVGTHPVFSKLAGLAVPILAQANISGFELAEWDPFRFVDFCQRVERQSSPANVAARQIQWIEMSLHLAHCCQAR